MSDFLFLLQHVSIDILCEWWYRLLSISISTIITILLNLRLRFTVYTIGLSCKSFNVETHACFWIDVLPYITLLFILRQSSFNTVSIYMYPVYPLLWKICFQADVHASPQRVFNRRDGVFLLRWHKTLESMTVTACDSTLLKIEPLLHKRFKNWFN